MLRYKLKVLSVPSVLLSMAYSLWYCFGRCAKDMEDKFLSVVTAEDQEGCFEATPSGTRHSCVDNRIRPLVCSGEPREVVTSP